MRVLVVENELKDYRLLEESLRSFDPAVFLVHAPSIENAARSLDCDTFDIVVTALFMPDSEGLETLHRIRKYTGDLPVVVYTRVDDPEVAMDAVRQGAQDFLAKSPACASGLLPDGELIARCLKYAIERRKWQIKQRTHMQDAWLMQQAQQEVQEKLKRRDEFLAMLSHEIRTPISAIAAAVKLMDRSREGDNSSRPLRIMHRQCEQIAALLDQLLEVCRLHEDRIELRHESVDVKFALQEAIDAVCEKIDCREQSIELNCNQSPAVSADPIRLHQIFVNLLTNAAKYTPEQGAIAAEIETEEDYAVIHIRDSGIGIAPENIELIFEPFFQESRDGKVDPYEKPPLPEGIGLGLALTKQLVALHGGSIGVTSSEYGSEFTIKLPLTQPASTPLKVPVEQKVQTGQDVEYGLNVVIVEDNDDAREMLELLLRTYGCDVASAATGNEGADLIAERHPDVAVLDIGLPDIDGYAVAGRVRQEESHHTHLIALTGYGQPDDLRRSKEAGFDEHLVKPIKMDQLIESLTAAARKMNRRVAGR